MANPTKTVIGRVVPFYVGAWDSYTVYSKLDNVLYNGSTYMALHTVRAHQDAPANNSLDWQLIASKGDTGGIGDVTADATSSDIAYASVVISGEDPSARNFAFSFGLPKGNTGDPAGIAYATATASQIGSRENPTVEVTYSGPSDAASLSFAFGIPAVEGGVSSVDGVNPSSGDVPLGAIRYNAVQSSLTSAQQLQARQNINAQVAGNYQPAGNYIVDPEASTNQYLYFNNEGNWVGKNINEVPTGQVSDVGKYLRKSNNGMVWASVQALPSGGAEGAPLVKNSVDDYDITWGTTISSQDIDSIFEE